MVYRFIQQYKDEFGVRWLCRYFGFCPNAYYNYLKGKKHDYYQQRDLILERIKYIYYENNGAVGYRAMKVFLEREGINLSNNTVNKYMNKMLKLSADLKYEKSGKNLVPKYKIFDNLFKQNFKVRKKNKVWCTDFTYMRQQDGKFRYNCTIIDLYDRSVIASINSNYLNSNLAIETLSKALEQEDYPKELILHSDQGVQFTSWDFVTFCKDMGVTQSMSKAGCPFDNALMERFYNTFKSCFYYRYAFDSEQAQDEMTEQYIQWYNYVRPHSYNHYLTPMEVRCNNSD